MEFTYEQANMFFIGVAIFTIIYVIIFSKKGINKTKNGYIQAIANCFIYGVSAIFAIIGVGIVKVAIEQLLYIGLIISLGWLGIIYLILKRALQNDFGINIHILKLNIKQKEKLNFIKMILLRAIIFVALLIVTLMIFIRMVPDTENQPNGIIPVILAGMVFGMCTLISAINLYYIIRKNIVKANKTEKAKENVKDIKIIFTYKRVVLLTVILMGILFFIMGIKDIKDYREKEETYSEVQGEYIGSKINTNSNDDTTTYYLIYSYKVNEDNYKVITNYSTSKRPLYGSQETILYNPNKPGEAIVRKNNISTSIIFIILGAIAIIVPIKLLIQNKNLNKVKQEVLH